MSFENQDKAFVERVANALYSRMNINTNQQNGCMTLFGADPDDRVNPELKLGKEEIKDCTGRAKLREVKLEEFKADFQKMHIDATVAQDEHGESYLHLKITPERAREVKFNSLAALEKKNQADLDEDPELGKPYYEY